MLIAVELALGSGCRTTIQPASLIGLVSEFRTVTAELKFELKRVQISTGHGDSASWVCNAVDRCQGSRFIG